MSVATNTAHLPALGAHERGEVGAQLQATLVELIDLSLVGKQLHWCVTGPTFLQVHEQLDVLVDSWRAMSDEVAERAVALGSFPDGQADAVAHAHELGRVERGAIEADRVIRELARRLADTAERVRGRMDRMGEIDQASQDILTGVVRDLEKQLWMVRSQLPHGGA
jgi:starvation-inducible DNA-binding protein